VTIFMVVSKINASDGMSIDGLLMFVIAIGVLWYTTVLGAIGATLGGRMTKR